MEFLAYFVRVTFNMRINFQTNVLMCVNFIVFVHKLLDNPTYTTQDYRVLTVCIFENSKKMSLLECPPHRFLKVETQTSTLSI